MKRLKIFNQEIGSEFTDYRTPASEEGFDNLVMDPLGIRKGLKTQDSACWKQVAQELICISRHDNAFSSER